MSLHPSAKSRHRTARLIQQTLLSYERQTAAYLRRWGRRRYRCPRLLVEWLKILKPGAMVLDLGCGPGQDVRYLREREFRGVGLDLAWPFLRFARQRSRRAPLVQADIRGLPFRPEPFDGIWAGASLIHLPKPAVRRTLFELHSSVHPGGILGATFTHGHTSGFLKTGWIPGRFFSRWLKAELANAVRCAGWEILSLQTVTNRERKGRWLNLLARHSVERQDFKNLPAKP